MGARVGGGRIRCSFITPRLREVYLFAREIVAHKLLGIPGFNNYTPRDRGERERACGVLENNGAAASASWKYFVTPQEKLATFSPRRESIARYQTRVCNMQRSPVDWP